MNIIQKIREMKREMTFWRQRLHADPELAFDERKTSRFLRRQLQTFGMDDIHTMAKTGLVAVLHGKDGPATPENGKKAIMLRADMDALPIHENSGVPHASRSPGVHHACGHDGHMAMLLGAAKYLASNKDFDGTVYFVFQPAEEHIGGANEMIKEGIFNKFQIDEVYGMHNFPNLPLGMMATGEGPMLAGNDDYKVTFKGKGGHTARPEETNDLVAAASEAILAIKEMIKKEVPKDEPAIVSVCSLKTTGIANNVLPDTIEFNGSIRSFDPALHQKLKTKVTEILEAAADKYGAEIDLSFENGYPILVNSKDETKFALDVAKETVGDKQVMSSVPRTLGVEDFAFFLQKKPGNFIALGTGPADGTKAPDLHSAKFDFNDAALPIGASYWVNLVKKALPRNAANNNNPPAPPATGKPNAPGL